MFEKPHLKERDLCKSSSKQKCFHKFFFCGL